MTTSIEAALQAFAGGEIVVVTDDDDREGEGDLVVAASRCTAEEMAFIIRYTSGIVCAPITRESARRLRPDPINQDIVQFSCTGELNCINNVVRGQIVSISPEPICGHEHRAQAGSAYPVSLLPGRQP